MKKLLVVLVFLLGVINFMFCQNNTVFVDSILSLVISSQIPIYSQDLDEISFLDVEIIRIDTVVCDEWTRPKYVDNIYNSAFDGSLIYSKNRFDTLTFQKDRRYLQFMVEDYDDNGIYLRSRVIFLIKKERGLTISRIEENEIITINDEYWRNKEIRIKGQQIPLDSCHLSYRISFFNDNSFKQDYSFDNMYCFTNKMKNNINLGLEVQTEEQLQKLNDFYNKVQGYYITNKTGKWYVQNNQLVLWLSDRKPIYFEILKMTNEELSLTTNSGEYQIELLKENGNQKN